MESETLVPLIGGIGLILLALSWHLRKRNSILMAQIGWVCVGFYFFSGAWKYEAQGDLVLTLMSLLALPMTVGLAYWESHSEDLKATKALHWARGAMAYAGGPYLLISHVPWLNVLAIWFVAWQSAALLSFAGGSDVTLGDTYANQSDGTSVLWENWDGNQWFLTEEMSEYSFHTELLVNGEPIYINFVLACTAIQSMIIFVGAISVLDMGWKKRVRALFISLSLIHILNLFRNAGLIWLQMGYPDWRWMNLTIFEFGHAYASRAVSLGAMFLLALVLFEMLPQMHKHVLTILRPLGLAPGKKKTQS